MRRDIADGDRDLGVVSTDEEGGEQPRDPREPQRRRGGIARCERQCAERPLQRGGEIELRIGERGRAREIEPRRAIDKYGGIRVRGIDLVDELQRRRAPCRYQDGRLALAVEGSEPFRIARLDGEQRQSVDRDRPAAPQRIDRARRGTRVRPRA